MCRILWTLALVGTVSCSFPAPPDVEGDADAAVDGEVVECEASSRTCEAGALSACGQDGRWIRYEVPNGGPGGEPTEVVLDEYPCPMGCDATEPRCADVLPSNGLAGAMDKLATSLEGLDVVIDDATGDALLSTQMGAPNGEVTILEAGGEEIVVPADVVTQPDGPDIVVLKVRSFTLAEGVRLKSLGVGALAITSHLDVRISGHLDLSGTTRGSGPSTNAACNVEVAPGPRGGAGNYGVGGAASDGSAGGSSLATVSPGLVPLEGGCTSFLGIGGGAVQIVSRTRIVIASTGVINVSGRGGQGIVNGGTLYVPGGGSGGGVLLEAPSVVFELGARIAGRGGAGAAGNTTNNVFASGTSGDADLTATSVPGGTCTGCGTGGSGGTESTSAGAGVGAGTAVAGGGGAIGRCVAATRSGILQPPAGVMKIRFEPKPLLTR